MTTDHDQLVSMCLLLTMVKNGEIGSPKNLEMLLLMRSVSHLILCFHKDALINAKNTNIPNILELLEVDISEKKIIFASIYGMDLYLKFNTKFTSDNEELNYIETSSAILFMGISTYFLMI
ncbi:hypothetical protein D3C80_1326270 [compost metagenome]